MTEANLLRLHVESLQRSCVAISNAADQHLPATSADTGRSLFNLAGRLPGFISPQAELESAQSILQSLALIQSARGSIAFLTEAGQFSDLGLRIAQGISSDIDALEADFGQQLRQEARHRIRGLYVIIDPLSTGGRPPEFIAEQALEGGANILQLRDKTRDKGLSMSLACQLKELCNEKDALLIINDHADLAASMGADGVHVGQGDLPWNRPAGFWGTTSW